MSDDKLESLARLDRSAALEYFDAGAVQRGISYAADARVRILSIRAHVVSAVCEGSQSDPYVVSVTWFEDDLGGEISSECTCPVEIDCKHGVAVFLVAHARARGDSDVATEAPVRRDWRRVLGEPDDHAEQAELRPLALQFRVDRSRATRWDGDGGPRLLVRPLRLGAKGRWVKSGAGWNDIASPYARDRAAQDPDHMAALLGLLAAAQSGSYYGAAEIALGSFDRSLWVQLAHGSDHGLIAGALEAGSGRTRLSDRWAGCFQPCGGCDGEN